MVGVTGSDLPRGDGDAGGPSYLDALEGVVDRELAAAATAPSPRATHAEVARTLAEVEDAVARSPHDCFDFANDGRATLRAGGRTHAAGRFRLEAIGDLRRRLTHADGALRFSVLLGAAAVTDIGALQAAATPGVMFQVASQFNCLEAPEPCIVPVRDYVWDYTQGPRASVSAFPGTLLRHYLAPSIQTKSADAASKEGPFTQTDERQIDLLADAFGRDVAAVRHGYLTSDAIANPPRLAALLEERFERIRIGVHDDIEVVFGHDLGGPVPRGARQRIAQALTSTLALGGYSAESSGPALAAIRRQLLRAAYLGTVLAALDLRKHAVVLTCIGGGVFGNPHEAIWDAILWALDEAQPLAPAPLHVVLNARGLSSSVSRDDIRRAVAARGGVFADGEGRS